MNRIVTGQALIAFAAVLVASPAAKAGLLEGIIKAAVKGAGEAVEVSAEAADHLMSASGKAIEHAVTGSVDLTVGAGKASVGATSKALDISGGAAPSRYRARNYEAYRPEELKPRKAYQEPGLDDGRSGALRSEFSEDFKRVQQRIDSELSSGRLTQEQARSLNQELAGIGIRERESSKYSKLSEDEADSLLDAIDRVDARLARYLLENERVGNSRH